MKSLKKYFELQKQIYEYFGYEENWAAFPMEDCTQYYWQLSNIGSKDEVYFAKKEEDVINENGNCFDVYYDDYILKFIYRGDDYTMIIADTQTNIFLQIYDNKKEVKGKENGTST